MLMRQLRTASQIIVKVFSNLPRLGVRGLQNDGGHGSWGGGSTGPDLQVPGAHRLPNEDGFSIRSGTNAKVGRARPKGKGKEGNLRVFLYLNCF